jgi:LacI family transcriptional regulator
MSSIQEVAQKAGVSIATVSRTFSAPNLINEHTQKRVLEAARELDYQPRRARPSGAAGVRASALSDAIGFQFFGATSADTLHTNTFYMPVLAGAQAEAAALGLHLLLHATNRHSLSLELPRMALERAVGGMLLVGTADPSVLSRFAQHVPHIVLVDNRDETGMYESVVSDGFGGAFTATRYLLELGHRRIAYFLSEPGIVTFQDRLRGYQCALWEAGMAADPDLIVMDNCADQSAESLLRLLTSPDAPTALLTANDYCAFHAIRVCRGIGLRIPDDISLIGFDDIPFSMHTDMPLTTMRVDKEAMGRLAVRRLYARMQAEGVDNCPPVCNLLPVALVARQSCHAIVDTCHVVTYCR